MKTTFAILLLSLLFHLTAVADPALDISRVSYYPHQGDFQLNTRLIYPIQNYSDSLATKARIQVETATETNSISFDAGLTYGIFNWLRFSISENVLLTSGSFSNLPPATTYSEVYSQGPSDPFFTLTSRILDPHNLGLSADVALTVSPSSGSHSLGKPGQLGDNYRGFSNTSLSIPVFLAQRSNDIETQISATQSSQGAATGSTPANSYTRQSTIVYTMSLLDRLHFSWFYLQGGIDLSLPYTNQQTTGAAVVRLISYPAVFTQRFLAGFRLNRRATLDMEITHSEFNLSTSADDGTSTVSQQRNTEFTLQLRFGI